MSEVRLVIREPGLDWSGTLHGSSAERAIAALSADPLTLAELQAACARFAMPMPNVQMFANLSPGIDDEPYDAGLVIIDLEARLVVVDSTYLSPRPTGQVCYHDGRSNTETQLRYHLAEDWLLMSDRCQWRAVAERRRLERTVRPPLDVRGVFYGRPLLEFVARETFAAFTQRRTVNSPQAEWEPDRTGPRTDQEVAHDTLKQIHAAWLLSPRADLNGARPRDMAFDRHNHLTWDLQDQCERWSLLGKCPPGLDKSSFAFRHGGFGTHELVQYYGLVRELLWSCWQRLVECEKTPSVVSAPDTLVIGDFLAGEVPLLESDRDQWLDSPDPECHGRTPRSIIERERARLPEGMSGHDAMIDADYPCCQMLADMPGPMFWHLDGSGMDDDFAFDIRHRTREEWEAEQREWKEFHERFDAEWSERQRLGVTDSGDGASGRKFVGSPNSSMADTSDVPLGKALRFLFANRSAIVLP